MKIYPLLNYNLPKIKKQNFNGILNKQNKTQLEFLFLDYDNPNLKKQFKNFREEIFSKPAIYSELDNKKRRVVVFNAINIPKNRLAIFKLTSNSSNYTKEQLQAFSIMNNRDFINSCLYDNPLAVCGNYSEDKIFASIDMLSKYAQKSYKSTHDLYNDFRNNTKSGAFETFKSFKKRGVQIDYYS